MSKKLYPKIEYSVVLFVILGVLLLVMPFSIENTTQAGFISKWNERLNRVEYMFSVLNAHITDDMLKSMKKAQTNIEREKLLLTIIKPYLRVKTDIRPPKRYKPKYMNGTVVNKKHHYYFEDFYFSKHNSIIGIKDIHTNKPDAPWFIMMFDINGILPPNRWGRDIFGIDIYENGRIEPFGYNSDMQSLKQDCSKNGTGIECSYYYKIGGGFDD